MQIMKGQPWVISMNLRKDQILARKVGEMRIPKTAKQTAEISIFCDAF